MAFPADSFVIHLYLPPELKNWNISMSDGHCTDIYSLLLSFFNHTAIKIETSGFLNDEIHKSCTCNSVIYGIHAQTGYSTNWIS